MKIVSSSIPPAEKPGAEPSAPPPKAVVKPVIIEVDPDTLSQDQAQMQQISRDMASLTRQVADLRKTITDIQKIVEAAARKEPPAEKPVEPVLIKMPLETKVEPAAPSVTHAPAALDLQSEKSEKKVAFLGKLWDYFNETAFEVPHKKSDRKDK
jgi:hypothetical protein